MIDGGKVKRSYPLRSEIPKLSHCINVKEEKIAGLIYATKMAINVDTWEVQDGYDLYHHVIFLTRAHT